MMKKLLLLFVSVLLSASVFYIAACKDNDNPAPQGAMDIDVTAKVYNAENKYVSYYGKTGIYYLKSGEVYRFTIADDHKRLYNNYDHETDYFSRLIYRAEEADIVFTEENDYRAEYTLKGLKKGSVIIQYEVKYVFDSSEGVEETHFISPLIQIIFE